MLQEGLTPFILAAVFMSTGLALACYSSIRRPNEQTLLIRISNPLAMIGFVIGFQLRFSAYLYGVFPYGKDSLPKPSIILLMVGLYMSLRFLLVNYRLFKKADATLLDSQEFSLKLIVFVMTTAFLFVCCIVIEFLLQR